MLVRSGATLLYGLFDAVFRPSQFVRAQTSTYSTSRVAVATQAIRLTLVWGVNLVLYALPLTLSGIGFSSEAAAPPAFGAVVGPVVQSPDTAWQVLVGFVQNSAFLTVATGLALVAFHGSVLVVRRSRGFVQSLHTVVYTTSAYLAGMFTVVMFLSTADGLARAREFVLTVQANFILGVIDLLNVDLTLPGVQTGSLELAGLTQSGATLIAVLAVLSLYFLYSMYLGARLNHGMSRVQAWVVVAGVLASPAAYIAGSALVTIAIQLYGVQIL